MRTLEAADGRAGAVALEHPISSPAARDIAIANPRYDDSDIPTLRLGSQAEHRRRLDRHLLVAPADGLHVPAGASPEQHRDESVRGKTEHTHFRTEHDGVH